MKKSTRKKRPRQEGSRSKLSALLKRLHSGSDPIEIGAPLPSYQNPLFAWALSQCAQGNTAALNGELECLSETEEALLTSIRERPSETSALIEQWQGELTESQAQQFAGLLARMADENPLQTATMADARKRVAGVKWLWRKYLPYGMLVELLAQPGFGKSALALYGLVRPVILGCNWPDGLTGLDGWKYVVWCDTEHTMAITLDRIEKWKLPAGRILLPFPEDVLRSIQLENPEHLLRLHNLINLKRPHLLIVDSLRGSHKQDENSSRVAQVLENLADLVQRTKVACAIVHHTRKLWDDSEIRANDSRGSNAIVALVRCQIALDRPDPQSKWTRVQVLKENLGVKPMPFGFRFAKNGLEFGDAPEPPSNSTKLDQAEQFLRENMKEGQTYQSAELIALADEAGISKRTLQRAATERLGIKPSPIREDGKLKGSEWQLRAKELGLKVVK